MQLRSRLAATSVAVIPLLALVAAPAALLAADPPVTLRFAIADEEGRPSDPYVRAFVQEVALRSGGSVTLDPTWSAGGDDFEQGVARLLIDGQADLGLAAGRAWSAVGIPALQSLQAPFLIDSDELAEAVATDPLVEPLLAAMGEGGVTGLAVWPEDLRHPVAFEPCMGPVTSPTGLQGRTVRAIASDVTFEIIEALGAIPIFVDDYGDLVASCEIQAAESGLRQGVSLPGTPTFTGDVTFFPKYQVLAANATAFDKLSLAQQTAVREAAEAVRDQAIAEHPTEADAAAAWCAGGGSVVLAGPDAVSAFETAAQPVFDRMAADTVSGPAIEAIRELRSTVERTETAAACEPTAPRPTESPVITATITPAFGTYRTRITPEDLARFGATPSIGGTITFDFESDAWSLTWADDSPGGPGTCTGPWAVEDGVMRLDVTAGFCLVSAVQVAWSQEGDALTARVIGAEPSLDIAEVRAVLESHPFVRID